MSVEQRRTDTSGEGTAPGAGLADPWRLTQRAFDPARAARDETLFALANGTLGVRGALEEDDSPSDGTFLSSVFEQNPIHYHERFPGFTRSTDTRVPVAEGKHIRLRLGDAPLRLHEAEWLDFERTLDLAAGALVRRPTASLSAAWHRDRDRFKELVVGGAASHKQFVETIIAPVVEKKFSCKVVFEGSRSLVNLEKMQKNKDKQYLSVVRMDDPVMIPAVVVVTAIITATVYVGDAVPIHISLLNVAGAEVVVVARPHKIHRT